MLRAHLTMVFRTLRRQKGYAALNVAGLALGLACALLILRYVADERSYDRFHADADHVYRVAEDRSEGGRVTARATSPAPLAPLLAEGSPAVSHAVRLFRVPGLVSTTPMRRFQEEGFFFVDPAFFDVFTFALRRGQAATALKAPFMVVLTEAAAARYFGQADPLGQRLTFRTSAGTREFTVTGVVEDVPATSHLQFQMLGSFATVEQTMPWYNDWWYPPMHTYVRFRAGTDAAAEATRLAASLPGLVARHAGEAAPTSRYTLQRLTDIHLTSHREDELAPNGHVAYVRLFTLVAFGILGIACINFMNLATARAASRAREVGVRKAVGALRRQLVGQFLAEAVVLAAVAGLLAMGLARAALPLLNEVAGRQMTLDLSPGILGVFAMLVLGVGLLAGSYPALHLSAVRPIRALRGLTFDGRSMAVRIRRGLTVAQFALSVALLVGVFTIRRQLDHVREARLGFDKQHVVTVPLRDQANAEDHRALKASWEAIPGVRYVAAASGTPGMPGGLHSFLVVPEGARADSTQMHTLTVDYDYAEALGLQFVAGRDFDAARPADATAGFVLNESAARALGWEDGAVGKRLSVHYYVNDEVIKTGEVIGVVKDFQYHSLRQSIAPAVLHVAPGTYYNDYLAVRLAPGNVTATLAAMGRAWAQFNPERPFEYTFLDAQFDALYRSEARLGTFTSVFAALAILVACIGLFGLAAYVAEQRTKEVGIRKVLGATARQLVALLTGDFLRPVLLGALAAVPLAYYAMDRWLEGFTERIALGPDLFLIATAAALAVALLTVAGQALRATSVDPVRALRYE